VLACTPDGVDVFGEHAEMPDIAQPTAAAVPPIIAAPITTDAVIPIAAAGTNAGSNRTVAATAKPATTPIRAVVTTV
jgi:hypothetical protein